MINKVEDLPRELLLHIFFYLQGDYLWRNQRVCKAWKKKINPEKEKLKVKTKNLINQASSWCLLSEEQYTAQLVRRRTYATEVDYMYFYLMNLKNTLSAEIRVLERISRSIEDVFEKSTLFTDVCLLFPHLFSNYVRVYKIQRYYFEMNTSDHIFYQKRLDTLKIPVIRSDNNGQKFTIIVKPNLKIINDELQRSEFIGNAEEYMKDQVKKLFSSWVNMYNQSIKKVPILSYYNFENCDILYTRKGFTMENFLKSGNNEVYKPAVYCLLAQNKLK